MNRSALLIAAVVAICAGGWWLLRTSGSSGPVAWQGYADADFVKIGPTQQGLVIAVRVARGDRVDKGAPLFEQDGADDRDGVTQAGWQLQQARDILANLNSAAKPTEIAQAEANVRDAEAARDKIQSDLERNEALLKTGAATVQLVDQEQSDLRSGNAKIAAMQAMLDQSKAPLGRPNEITAQSAAVDAAVAALRQARWRLEQRSVVAPAAGVVADVLARPGETLAAGAPVVSLLPPENIYVRFFVPEPELARVRIGDEVKILCDNCPSDLTGKISYVAPQAEYTPPFIYSQSTVAKFVFLAEARPIANQATRLNPGQPVSIAPLAEDQASPQAKP